MRAPWRWPLRTRLLALLLLLLTAVSAAIVGVTALQLRSYLVDQVDGRLLAVDHRWEKPPPGESSPLTSSPGQEGLGSGMPDPDLPPFALNTGTPAWQGTPDAFVGLRGQSFGTVAARVANGQADAVVLRKDDVIVQLDSELADKLATVPANQEPQTVSLSGLGNYRVIARTVPNSSDVVVSGLSLTEVDATVNRLLIVAGAVAGGGVLLLGVIGAVTVRRTLRPLRRVAATAAQVAELPLDRGEVTLRVRVPDVDTDPRTEVGQVGAALNHMLGHVGAALAARHASEMRVRQFVADASHELRTPLAAISGYAELVRRIGSRSPQQATWQTARADAAVPVVAGGPPRPAGPAGPAGPGGPGGPGGAAGPAGAAGPGGAAVPPEVAYAMSRVESEAKRMTALVEDLLLLARLDSGRPLEHGDVDLSRLVVDVVSDAHIAAPGHRFRLDLPPEPVIVLGDQARLHQVLANLLANARTHTPAGTSVIVALELDRGPGEIRLSVTDDGPGMPAELLPNVFERFARGDSSRSRTAGSTGLGLAIVAAVVEAHRGRITVTSVPGRTAFTVTLPVTSARVPPAVAGIAGALCTAVDAGDALAPAPPTAGLPTAGT